MRKLPNAKIVGTGRAVPTKILSNQDLEKIVDTSDEWIRTRTGMEIRHIATNGELTSDLCTEAARIALDEAGLKPDELDAVIIATVTGDVGFPSTACYVQQKLGAVNAFAYDISAACSGFIYGLDMADSLIATGKGKNILVVGGETLSKIVDYTDRDTCVLFGDGAGAAVLAPANDEKGILATYLKSDGRLEYLLNLPGLGTKNPPSYETVDQKMNFIKMEGREVFKYAVTAMGEAAEKILKISDLSNDDVDVLITHQANLRIIDATARRIKVPSEKVYVNIHKYGNTSAASIPIALDEARKSGRLQEGHLAVLVAFGAGFTWGSTAIRF